MHSDFDMIVHNLEQNATIIPVSDVHFGALEHNEKAWKLFCKMVEQTPDLYIMLGGDLINNSTRNSVANPFDEVYRPREQKRRMVEYLKPIKDKVLCAVSGNHERRSLKDDDIDLTYDIMSKLDIEDLYRANMAFSKIGIGKRSNRDSAKASFIFALTHGTGGGIFTGATVNRNERFGNIIEGLDCLVIAHTHKGTVTRPSKIVVDPYNNLVKMKSYTVVSCVSWMNYGGYAAQKMLLPSDTCIPQKIFLSGDHTRKSLEVLW